ncbi:MAG: hypothetical protein ACYC9X_06115 [Dehalococcoidia bacterium]
MPKFPSVEWFEAVGRRVADERERFKHLGYVDANVGVKVDNGGATKGYLLEFAGYGVRRVREVADPAQLADFTIEGRLDDWKSMIENIRDHGEPDLGHTLNRLTMAGTPMQVVAKDQLQVDLFYRFNQSIQAFFNEAAGVTTEFSAG